MSWIKFKGVLSDDMALIIRKSPIMHGATERVNRIAIPGVDGDRVQVDGTYEPYDTDMEVTLTDDARRFEVFNWLRGAGDLETQHKPGYVCRARVNSSILPEHVAPNVKNFMVGFHCQPFWYEASPETVFLAASGYINSAGTRDALPIITVTGTGTLTIDSDAYVFTDSGVTINSEIEECYSGLTNKNSTVSGGFPVLSPGIHTVTLAGLTSVSIQVNPRWF